MHIYNNIVLTATLVDASKDNLKRGKGVGFILMIGQ